jgi:hypothetical protein
VVLALLTLFALVGLSFLLYAEAEARTARLCREAESAMQPDVSPELLLSFFLSQLLYDVKDEGPGPDRCTASTTTRALATTSPSAGPDVCTARAPSPWSDSAKSRQPPATTSTWSITPVFGPRRAN